jgi:hypothetical protein
MLLRRRLAGGWENQVIGRRILMSSWSLADMWTRVEKQRDAGESCLGTEQETEGRVKNRELRCAAQRGNDDILIQAGAINFRGKRPSTTRLARLGKRLKPPMGD